MKRFTATEKWNDPWFRKLSPKLKCLWLYMCDNCDPAGVIDLDLDLAAVHIGQKFERDDMLNFNGRIERLESGKLLVLKFIPFQFGKLSEDCRPHKSVFDALSKHCLQYPFNTLPGSCGILPERIQEQDKEKEQDKTTARVKRMTMGECQDFAVEIGLLASDGTACFTKWEGNGWKNGGSPIADVKATMRSWKLQGYMPSQKNGHTASPEKAEHGLHGAIKIVTE